MFVILKLGSSTSRGLMILHSSHSSVQRSSGICWSHCSSWCCCKHRDHFRLYLPHLLLKPLVLLSLSCASSSRYFCIFLWTFGLLLCQHEFTQHRSAQTVVFILDLFLVKDPHFLTSELTLEAQIKKIVQNSFFFFNEIKYHIYSQLEHSKHSMDYIELPAETYGNFMGVQEKDKQTPK